MAILTNRFKWRVRHAAIWVLKFISFFVMLVPALVATAVDVLHDVSNKFMRIVDRYVSWVLGLEVVRCQNCILYDQEKAKRTELCHVHTPMRQRLFGKKEPKRSRCLGDSLYYSDMTRLCPDYVPKEGELIAIKKD